MIGPILLLRRFVEDLTHAADRSDDWEEADDGADACSDFELAECRAERQRSKYDDVGHVVDLEGKAAAATYKNGAVKRTRYPRVKLATRRVVIVLHQTGVERPSSSKRWHLVTAHRVIAPNGDRMRLHPIDVRLTAANRLDRAPWHAISIEVGGNFEGVDGGDPDWYQPNVLGRGRATDVQLEACFSEVRAIVAEVGGMGGRVEAIAPHRIAGRDAKGRPNRQICPGSRVWSMVGERAGSELGLAIPAPGLALGGLTIPDTWHGPHYAGCTRLLRG
jgi:hypothetical protein